MTNRPNPMRRWLEARAHLWLDAGDRLARVRSNAAVSVAEALALAQDYRQVARDWSIARQAGATPATRAHLAGLYGQLHHELHRAPTASGSRLLRLVRDEAPAAVCALRPHIVWVTTWFVATACFGWLLVESHPELITLVASESMINAVEHGKLWTSGLVNVVPSSIMAVGIFTNNIAVSLFACCLGVFYGLGTLYIIGVNGIMLGAAFAFTARYGLAWQLLEFVLPHGIVELSVICLSGAVGVSLGEALVRPGQHTRRDAFERASRRALKVMLVAMAFLVGAGVIEGYVSPDPAYGFVPRAVVGVAYAIVFYSVMRGTRAPRSAGSA